MKSFQSFVRELFFFLLKLFTLESRLFETILSVSLILLKNKFQKKLLQKLFYNTLIAYSFEEFLLKNDLMFKLTSGETLAKLFLLP